MAAPPDTQPLSPGPCFLALCPCLSRTERPHPVPAAPASGAGRARCQARCVLWRLDLFDLFDSRPLASVSGRLRGPACCEGVRVAWTPTPPHRGADGAAARRKARPLGSAAPGDVWNHLAPASGLDSDTMSLFSRLGSCRVSGVVRAGGGRIPVCCSPFCPQIVPFCSGKRSFAPAISTDELRPLHPRPRPTVRSAARQRHRAVANAKSNNIIFKGRGRAGPNSMAENQRRRMWLGTRVPRCGGIVQRRRAEPAELSLQPEPRAISG